MASPRATEVVAITTKVREKEPLLRAMMRLARKNGVSNAKVSLLCKSMPYLRNLTKAVTWRLVCFLAMLPLTFLQGQVIPAAARKGLYLPYLEGKNIGLVANSATVAGDQHLVDLLVQNGIKVACIFSPEHGFRLTGEAGETIGDTVDPATGIRVISLYGKGKKPSREALQPLDLVVFDLQDVGVRFYTYISTLTYVMEACAEQGKPLLVLDRPNPNGFYVDGPVLEKEYSSFVGMHPVPVVYGMTIGEYAQMVNGEGWLKQGLRCDLRVIPVGNYTHASRYVLPVRPSPNLPGMDAVILYPSLCFFEGTSISVGRGTPVPFSVYGHPDLGYGDFYFTPVPVPGASLHPSHEGVRCRGEELSGYLAGNPHDSGRIVLRWLLEAWKDLGKREPFFNDYFEKLAGTGMLRQQILDGMDETEIRRTWAPGLAAFAAMREKYLLYP